MTILAADLYFFKENISPQDYSYLQYKGAEPVGYAQAHTHTIGPHTYKNIYTKRERERQKKEENHLFLK